MEKTNEKIKCIYGIRQLDTDKIIYIGKTVDLKSRISKHLNRIKYTGEYIKNNGGKPNFSFEILESINDDLSEEEMLNHEQHFIDLYDTINSGINRNRSGNISKDPNYSNEYRKEHPEYFKTEKWKNYNKEYHKEYFKTEKWRAYKREWQKSEKQRAYHREYAKSEKYKEYLKKYREKQKNKKCNDEVLPLF